MTVEQIRVGHDNFSYVIFCPMTRKAALVDPGYDASTALESISSENLDLLFIIITHHHGDHSSDSKRVKNLYSNAQVIASRYDGAKVDVTVDRIIEDNDELAVGTINLVFLLTPGHTPGGICVLVGNEAIITGDTLFIGDCGRTDLPGGSLAQMYKTLQEKIKPLPDHLLVYPGHDYGDKPFDTLGNQKQTNKTLLAKNLEEFSQIP